RGRRIHGADKPSLHGLSAVTGCRSQENDGGGRSRSFFFILAESASVLCTLGAGPACRLDESGYNDIALTDREQPRATAMKPFELRLVNSGADDVPPIPDTSRPEPTEQEALDAYSRVIVTVAETLGPAVVNLRSIASEGGRRPRGAGSGFLFAPDGF